MTIEQAIDWVNSHDADDELDQDELRDAFTALVGRKPDPDENTAFQWDTLCDLQHGEWR
jgi:hypothetical protein